VKISSIFCGLLRKHELYNSISRYKICFTIRRTWKGFLRSESSIFSFQVWQTFITLHTNKISSWLSFFAFFFLILLLHVKVKIEKVVKWEQLVRKGLFSNLLLILLFRAKSRNIIFKGIINNNINQIGQPLALQQ